MRPPLPEFPADASPTAQLMRRLFVDLREPTGGPMHIVLEDGNVEDGHLDYCASDANMAYLFDGRFERYAQAGDDVSDQHKQAIRDTCAEITALLRPMTEAERRKTINEFWAWWAPNATAVMIEQAGGYDDEEDDTDDGVVDPLLVQLYDARLIHGPSWNAQLREEDQRPEEPKACVTTPCPPFEEVTLDEARPTLLWVSLHGHNLETGRGAAYRWETADGVPFEAVLPASWFEQMMAPAAPRFPIPPETIQADIPRVVVLPDHVTIDQAERALIVCRDLGLLQDLPHGVMFLPAGVVS